MQISLVRFKRQFNFGKHDAGEVDGESHDVKRRKLNHDFDVKLF